MSHIASICHIAVDMSHIVAICQITAGMSHIAAICHIAVDTVCYILLQYVLSEVDKSHIAAICHIPVDMSNRGKVNFSV